MYEIKLLREYYIKPYDLDMPNFFAIPILNCNLLIITSLILFVETKVLFSPVLSFLYDTDVIFKASNLVIEFPYKSFLTANQIKIRFLLKQLI